MNTQLAINATERQCLDSFNATCKQLERELESPLERLHLANLPVIHINADADVDMDLPFTVDLDQAEIDKLNGVVK